MAIPIIMPKQGQSVETCVINQWHLQVGDSVAEGQLLFSYETDKAAFEFHSPASGVLLGVLYPVDTDVPVLATVAVIGESGEDVSTLSSAESTGTSTSALVVPVSDNTPITDLGSKKANEVEVLPPGETGGFTSPRARLRAQRRGIDTSAIVGSGPSGRVIERDVLSTALTPLTRAAFAELQKGVLVAPAGGHGIGSRVSIADLSHPATASSSNPLGGFTEVKLSPMRKIIATRMLQSLSQSAQLTMNIRANASAMIAFRKRAKHSDAEAHMAEVTITDLLSFALIKTLVQSPEINVLFVNDVIRRYNDVHLAIAMDTPRGLMVPVVRNAQNLTIIELSHAIKSLAAAARSGSIDPDLLSGGTITLTNLGMFGIESFTPILNAPQVAILGVNAIIKQLVVGEDDSLKMVPFIGLSLTIDHRVLDGAPAARFLQHVATAIEKIDVTLAS